MKHPRGKRHGVAMMVWLFFANLFEPAKIAATERIDTQSRIGSDAARAARGVAAPPPDR